MIRLYDAATNVPIGTVTDDQWQFVMDQLEEESLDDREYYINRATLDLFGENGGDAALIELFEGALGDGDDLDIRWERL